MLNHTQAVAESTGRFGFSCLMWAFVNPCFQWYCIVFFLVVNCDKISIV
jgi:hypothetical protein